MIYLYETGSGWWFGWHVLFSQKYWEANHPNWRTHIFQRGGTQPPTRVKFSRVILQFASRDEFPEDALPSLVAEEKMGAKDALCKVATMNIGLEDTLAYYSPEELPGTKSHQKSGRFADIKA